MSEVEQISVNAEQNVQNVKENAIKQVSEEALQEYASRDVKFSEPLRFSGNMMELKSQHPKIYNQILQFFSQNIFHDMQKQQARLKRAMRQGQQNG